VRRSEENRPRLLLAAGVVLIHVRVAAATTRQVIPSRLAECVRHIARGAALIAFDPQIFGLKRRTAFEEAKRSFAAALPVMNEVVPGEIVQMAASTGQEEAGRN